MRTALIAFAAGCATVQWLPALPPWWTAAATLAIACVPGWIGLRAREDSAAALGGGALTAWLLGAAWALGMAQWRMAETLPESLEGRDVEVLGVITSLPQRFERGVRFVFSPEQVLSGDMRLPSRLLVSWYGGFSPEARAPDPEVHAGERWRLNLRLKRPHGSANPHGFDYEAWLLQQGIRATGYVRPPREEAQPRRLAEFAPSPATVVERARERIRDRLERALADAPHGGVIVALAVGDQRAIDGSDWDLFTRTGVGHLMSISGLHVTMIASLSAWLAFAFWRRVPRLMLALAAPRAAAVAGLVAALAYCLLAGFAVPAQRTLFMLAVAAWALWRGWFGSGLRILSIALALVCLADPWAPLAPGFWLSFGAVAILIVAGAGVAGREHWLPATLRAQLAVTLGLVPLSLILFQQISLVGPLANAVAIPLVSFVITPLALLSALIPLDALTSLAHALLTVLIDLLEWLGAQRWAVWQRAVPPLWTVVLALAGAIWMLIPWWAHWRVLGGIWVLPLLVHPAPVPAPGTLWLHVLDVGQGLAVVARTHAHALVFDSGPRYTPEADGGNRVVVPFLRGEGVVGVDALVLSHDDSDHTGGARSVAAAARPAAVFLPRVDLAPPGLPAGVRLEPCARGQAWTWDGVRFEFLSPPAADDATRDNDRSCVLSISAHGRRVLLTADIEAGAEAELLASGIDLRADALLVPHHGSRTSSTGPFLDAVGARTALLAVGYRNRFRHPAPEVMSRYAARGIAVHRTDLDGAITLAFEPDGERLATWRAERPRYWHAPVERSVVP